MNYVYLICPFISLMMCQIFKMIFETIKTKKLDLKRIFASGAMPSSHASFTSSIAFLIGYLDGFDSNIFALALVVVLVTCYDAINVRYESGKHAKILNERFNLKMKEQIGHKFLEVVVGLTVGLITATLMYYVIYYYR